jgi:ATP-dependent DNA helicase RecG
VTPEVLRDLIAAGETLDVEFKGEEKAPLSDRELFEAVVCLANRSGEGIGWLLIGVEDDGRVTGQRPRHEAGRTDPRRVQALVASNTRPSMSCRAELVRLDEGDVLCLEVPAVRRPVGTANGHYTRRGLEASGRPACFPYHFHEMHADQAGRGQQDYSQLVLAGARWDDLDPLEFERFRRSIRETGHGDRSLLDLPDVELGKALGVLVSDGPDASVRVAGMLLFGKEEALRGYLPTHEVAFQQLAGAQVEVNDFLRAPLLRVMDDLIQRLRARNREQELMVGARRVGVPDVPELAYREAVANALIHRDYTRLGAVHVQWHEDRLEMSSPGGFPEGVRLENLLVTPPKPRNPLLADAFKRAGLVERTARGIDYIFFEQLRNGRPAPSYDRSTEASVVLVLPGGEANLEFVRMVVEEGLAGREIVLDDLLTLNALQHERQFTTADVSALIQRPEGEARAVLGRLVEAGLIEPRGERKGRSYHLSAATYRRLGEKAEYVRLRGFEPIQQEQMVLQYVRKNGRITRGEAMELCRVTGDQAKRLLRRMVDDGRLRPHGERKATWYGLRP